MSSSTARSTTTPNSPGTARGRAIAIATRSDTKRFCTPTRSGATSASAASGGCSRSRSGTRRSRRLFGCVRDRLGVKPLYYAIGAASVSCSPRRSRRCWSSRDAGPDDAGGSEYLALRSPQRGGDDVRGRPEARAGALASSSTQAGLHGIAVTGTSPFRPENRPDAEWIAEFRDRLEETVRMRLMSDVPLGVFLSGGLDSSAITALMTGMFRDG